MLQALPMLPLGGPQETIKQLLQVGHPLLQFLTVDELYELLQRRQFGDQSLGRTDAGGLPGLSGLATAGGSGGGGGGGGNFQQGGIGPL